MEVGNSRFPTFSEVGKARQAAEEVDELQFIIKTEIYHQLLGLLPAQSVALGFMFPMVSTEVKAALLEECACLTQG